MFKKIEDWRARKKIDERRKRPFLDPLIFNGDKLAEGVERICAAFDLGSDDFIVFFVKRVNGKLLSDLKINFDKGKVSSSTGERIKTTILDHNLLEIIEGDKTIKVSFIKGGRSFDYLKDVPTREVIKFPLGREDGEKFVEKLENREIFRLENEIDVTLSSGDGTSKKMKGVELTIKDEGEFDFLRAHMSLLSFERDSSILSLIRIPIAEGYVAHFGYRLHEGKLKSIYSFHLDQLDEKIETSNKISGLVYLDDTSRIQLTIELVKSKEWISFDKGDMTSIWIANITIDSRRAKGLFLYRRKKGK
jgi:hypothetical protein